MHYQSTEDFILDKAFSSWVLHPNPELDAYWKTFLEEHPEKEPLVHNAILIIRALQPINQDIPQHKLDAVLQKVKDRHRTGKLKGMGFLKYAAFLIILLAVGSLIYLSVERKSQFPVEASRETIEKGRVIFANGITKEFDTDQTTIRQSISGNLTINADTVLTDTDPLGSGLNQVIIPYGKRSEITLADGTHIWLNSGSQLSYPSQFKAGSREVYLSGEAFFEVKADLDRPFYVITRELRIKVLGTSFNVSSYLEDKTVQTVLLKGKVSAGKNKIMAGTIDLLPGERLTYDKSKQQLSKDQVDVQLYASWVNGYLIFKNKPLTEVFTQLKRFYNQDILVDESLEGITFSGKLDMKSQLKDVLENIAFASSVKVNEKDGTFQIK